MYHDNAFHKENNNDYCEKEENKIFKTCDEKDNAYNNGHISDSNFNSHNNNNENKKIFRKIKENNDYNNGNITKHPRTAYTLFMTRMKRI